MAGEDEAKGTNELRGNTLRVYILLVRQGPSELREVQRALGLSTPSLASYHLNRLIEAGYAAQNPAGQYYSTKDLSGQILDRYTKIGPALIPQLTFFAVLFTVLITYFALGALNDHRYVVPLVITAAGLVGVLWFETLRVWRRLASWQ